MDYEIDAGLLDTHRRQMKALKEQLEGPWWPLKKILTFEDFILDLQQHMIGIDVIHMKEVFEEWAENTPLVENEQHWLSANGVNNMQTQSYVFGWEDLQYKAEETTKYLLEARNALVGELARIAKAEEGKIKFYVTYPELVTKTVPRIEVAIRILYKVERENDGK